MVMKMMSDMLYHFPRIIFVSSNNIGHQLEHIKEEVGEAYAELGTSDVSALAIEIMDIYHSAETALRILEEDHGVDIKSVMFAVAEKNEKRGYYPCATP
jgi:NTP pyrophosphatase (non-canonical NTP hydrolase)